MHKKQIIILLGLLLSYSLAFSQASEQGSLKARAQSELDNGHIVAARYNFIRAFEDYVNKDQMKQAVDCGAKATQLYYKENLYKEAFDLLRRIDQVILSKESAPSAQAALQYYTSKERMQMYMKLRRAENAKEHLAIMERYAETASDDAVKNDLLFSKAVYYYTFGLTAQGNAVFKEMADKLTASKEYDKVEEVYKTLIANGRNSGSATMVDQSYSSYLAWKDSVNALKAADTIQVLHNTIAAHEQSIAEKDSSLAVRKGFIIGLCVIAIALIAALVLGALVLMRYIMLTKKQKKTISMVNENNALKAQFIGNISRQLAPTLQKLNSRQPEVKALLDFTDHIETLSELENSADEKAELKDTPVQPLCEALAAETEKSVKSDVAVEVVAPKVSAPLNKDYLTHILRYLLNNAAERTPAGGKIRLEYKKRGPHKHQFLVTDTGEPIPADKHEEVFKPFVEVRDLTEGDGLGLPICRQMAVKMNGDLSIDSSYTKGCRFVVDLLT